MKRVDLKGCPKCGGDHDKLDFDFLFRWFAICPKTRKIIVLGQLPGDETGRFDRW